MRSRIVFYQDDYENTPNKNIWLVGNLKESDLIDKAIGATKVTLDDKYERCVEINFLSENDIIKLEEIKSSGGIIEFFINQYGDFETPVNDEGKTLVEWRANRQYRDQGE